jgi:hypothetical protein
MVNARLIAVLAASSLAGIAYAQTQPAPSNNPGAAPGYNTSKPHQRQMTTVESKKNETASPNARPAPGAALNPGASASQSGTLRTAEAGAGGHAWTNMPVESSSGQSLGSVSHVVPGLNGQQSSGYVVVSGADNMSVPVPYRMASAMVRDGKLVLSPSQLEHAPKIAPEDMQNSADHSWRVKADRYWMHKGRSQAEK